MTYWTYWTYWTYFIQVTYLCRPLVLIMTYLSGKDPGLLLIDYFALNVPY